MFKTISREEYNKRTGGKVYGKNDCPFCNIENEQDAIIWKGKYWYLIYNIGSYSGDLRHIMAIPNEHILLSKELTKEHFEELKIVHMEVVKFFGEESYFSFTRETQNGNRSVEHLHIHFLVGNLQGRYLRKMLEQQGYPIRQNLYFDK